MPDLINPTYNDGKKKFHIWLDELCQSCKAQDNCPLLLVLHRHTIMTMTGMHVSNCDLYDPDTESEYYLSSYPDAEDVLRINHQATEQRLAEVYAKLERLDESFTAR